MSETMPGGIGGDRVSASPEVLESFAATHASIATAIGAAGTINAAANTAVMVPVFGLIGQEFLASFIAAQGNHLASVAELTMVHAATAASTLGALADFQVTDAGSAAVIGSVL
ncbi:type VII secretion target [Gordonia sp. ABSL1-1]|uniref:type VII secretion target n=1 Tax=Gordonia sp. ABSL1-1 TaxID=3053923 RepID=UPI0025738263|nr:type VII secretion target [Gordonia sp. ABSL1-1]MDL9936711.1 type VII secretion target [Gordonia sp. ABSL1-1]